MSLLREVLSTAQGVEMENIKVRVLEIKSETHVLEAEVLKFFDEVYLEFLQKPRKISEIIIKIENSKKELDFLKQRLEKEVEEDILPKDTIETLQKSIKESIGILLKIKYPCYVHDKLLDLKVDNYSEALNITGELEKIVLCSECPIISRYLKKPFCISRAGLFDKYEDILNRKFTRKLTDKNVSYLTVDMDIDVEVLLQALFQYNNHIEKLDPLIYFIWEFIFVPVITCESKVSSNSFQLKVVASKTKQTPNYGEVYRKLYRVNYFLQSSMSLCLDKTKGTTLLEYIGDHLGNKLSSLVISQCLNKIKPPNIDTITNYEEVVQDSEKLVGELKFLKLSDESILNYAKNLEQIHLDKNCDIFLDHAKAVMKQKNTDNMEVGTSYSEIDLSNSSDLPCMFITCKVQELLQIIEKILIDMKTQDDIHRFRLSQVVLSIFDYYKTFQKNLLEDMVAEDIALFHNDCKYITHELRGWNMFYSNILPDNIPPFKSELCHFNCLGEEAFNNFINIQRNKLISILDNQKSLRDLTDQSVRSCFTQLKNLREAWSGILPKIIYSKSMGVLIDTICVSFMKFILQYEYIEEKSAKNLSELFQLIIHNSQSYFSDPNDLKQYVKHWSKFETFAFVIGSDLIRLEASLCCDNSSLKNNLETSELNFLMRALFQNSKKGNVISAKLHA